MDALEQAFPNLTPAELLAKAHGQLLLEVMKKEVGWTFASWEFDFGQENSRPSAEDSKNTMNAIANYSSHLRPQKWSGPVSFIFAELTASH